MSEETTTTQDPAEIIKPLKPKTSIKARGVMSYRWLFLHRETTTNEEIADAERIGAQITSYIAVILFTVFACSSILGFYLQRAYERISVQQAQLTETYTKEELKELKVFTLDDIIYVVGTEAEYPRGASEMAKDIKELTIKVNETKQVADAALKQSNELDKALGKMLKERRKEK